MPTLQSYTFASHTSQCTDQSLQKSMPAPTQGKFQNIFSSPSKKIKTPDTQARQKSTRQMTQTDDIKMVVTHDRQERQPITAVWRNGGFSASYDSFVVGSSAVLRINICGKNPPLRQAANRYRQALSRPQSHRQHQKKRNASFHF